MRREEGRRRRRKEEGKEQKKKKKKKEQQQENKTKTKQIIHTFQKHAVLKLLYIALNNKCQPAFDELSDQVHDLDLVHVLHMTTVAFCEFLGVLWYNRYIH